MEIVIVGGGPAGISAAWASRQWWPNRSVLLIEAEEAIGCCRPLLPQFLAGQVAEEKVFLNQILKEDPQLKIITGKKVVGLDRQKRIVFLNDGAEINYERLLLASGGEPIIPPGLGAAPKQGIFPLRNLAQVKEARAWLKQGQQVFILGGGLVGVKTAAYLRKAGFQINLVEKEDQLLPQVLPRQAARFLGDYLCQLGIKIFLGETIAQTESFNGQIKRVRLKDQWYPCATLLLALGARPHTSFLKGSGLLSEEKLLVLPTLQTKDPRIFAAGDVAIIEQPDGRELALWTWPQAVMQGKLAAANFYRPNPLALKIFTKANSLNLTDLPLNIIEGSKEYDRDIIYASPKGNFWRQILLHEQKLVGAVFLGNISHAGLIHYLLINEKAADWTKLIRPTYQFMTPGLTAANPQRKRAIFFKGEIKSC